VNDVISVFINVDLEIRVRGHSVKSSKVVPACLWFPISVF